MKNNKNSMINTLLVLFVILLMQSMVFSFPVFSTTLSPDIADKLDADEITWLKQHQNEAIYVGFDPAGGMEYFTDTDGTQGYLNDILSLLSEKLNLNFVTRPDLNWGEAVDALSSGDIQLLFGANPTPERLKTMDFTNEIYSVPYTILSVQNGDVKNIGDINGKHIGFIEGDVVSELFAKAYSNLHFDTVFYPNQEAALEALASRSIDAFITSGGDVVYDYLFRYPQIQIVANLDDIRSLMTFASLKENQQLIEILTKSFECCTLDFELSIKKARTLYVRKILHLTDIEINWLKENPSINVGVPNDYLPIDYFTEGKYSGIAGHYLNSFAELIGLEIIAQPNSFDVAYNKMLAGELDLLNMAKTEERLSLFTFTDAFSNERDVIYGLKENTYVHDIYGLEGKKVAVIEGFWHIDHLKYNLQSPNLLIVKDIQEAIKAVVTHRADYFIETPAVADYYISGLGYNDIIKKGETSSDSFLYFGMINSDAPLASIFNKAKVLLNYENSKYLGIQEVPEIDNVANKRLIFMLSGAGVLLVALILILLKFQRDLFLTKERERLIYIDPLTGIYNRSYFNSIEKQIDHLGYPQLLFVLDINNLKIINDKFGHLTGDLLIDNVSKILIQVASKYKGTAIRMGGDEFVLLFTGISDLSTSQVLAHLETEFSTTSLSDQEHTFLNALEVAIGVATRSSNHTSFEALFREADKNMYINKTKMKS
ncbi:transporter substrate-binding domain-containing protein [Fusibacter bizertensis]|uniref:Transporter substrate-binding domain-containing protein n=1 Tax=Fusibacter bizertensis TaxID=1488331 RepID=A0ABT6NAD6_9FIRM|nr:transporter substrate-binding domain-containing protein [Fusibacter bizertensis]MDH8677375.1 transporter substrate-binding domain-containing protein [Fusibacter bizertensis]